MDDFICPECGAVLVHGRHDFNAHAFGHWGVNLRGVDRIPNTEAQTRYRSIIEADIEPETETTEETPVTGNIDIIEGDL